ncbi:FliO/MopB family protein [bacterium]|nr:FliO/MopB family protein [bacterium]
MTSYIISFVVYTTAMVGAIFLALFVYKKFSAGRNFSSKSDFLAVEDCINIGMRKQLYVVRAGKERFLIASDTERTTFLAKLNSDEADKTSLNEFFEKNIDYVKSDTRQNSKSEDEIYFLNDINKTKNAGEILHNIVNSGGRQ